MFPADVQEREAWVNTLQSLQYFDSGLFVEETHNPIHTTAHCIATLELFEQKALHPLTALHKYLNEEPLYEFLYNLRGGS